jgi:hypothetical protein
MTDQRWPGHLIVDIEDEQISLSDEAGEIVSWVDTEWIEESSVAAVIARYIVLGFEEGPAAIRLAVGHFVTPDGQEYFRMVGESNEDAHRRVASRH